MFTWCIYLGNKYQHQGQVSFNWVNKKYKSFCLFFIFTLRFTISTHLRVLIHFLIKSNQLMKLKLVYLINSRSIQLFQLCFYSHLCGSSRIFFYQNAIRCLYLNVQKKNDGFWCSFFALLLENFIISPFWGIPIHNYVYHNYNNCVIFSCLILDVSLD